MKTSTFRLLIIVAAFSSRLFGQMPDTKMLVSGCYTGKNLVVKNCYHKLEGYSVQAFSIREIKTNGYISTAEINSDIFEVPLEPLKLKIGDSVKVEIRYTIASAPKTKPSILNPGVLMPFQSKSNSTENRLTVEGQYSYGTLFFINPYNTTNKTYCVTDIKINGKVFATDLKKEIVSIDLNTLINKDGVREGDKIQIEFTYAKGSDPFILNPELITPSSTTQY